MQKFYNKKAVLIILLVGVVIFSLLASMFGVSDDKKRNAEESKNNQSSTVSPLAPGLQVYNVIVGSPRNPQISEVSFDPLDAKVGETQTITVKVKDNKNGAIVRDNFTKAIIKTDSKEVALDFKMIKAEKVGLDLVTTWQGSFILEDTNDKIYSVKINTKNIYGVDSTEVTLR